jgi:hypothetical protein
MLAWSKWLLMLESRTKTEKSFSTASEASPSNVTAPHRIKRIEWMRGKKVGRSVRDEPEESFCAQPLALFKY